MTDPNTPAASPAGALIHTGQIVRAATGELFDLGAAPADALADTLEDLDTLRRDATTARDAIVAELARRADQHGRRTLELDGVRLEVNAPTEDRYEVDALRAALEPLVADGTIAEALLDELVVTPPPKQDPPRVDRRRIAALAKSDNRRLLSAIASARLRVPTKRTVKVLGRAVETTAVEVTT